MAICTFCKRTFNNMQGVRSHLKHCPVYRDTEKRKYQCANCGFQMTETEDNSRDECPRCLANSWRTRS